jgi:ketosteroid isomerase-like protein
MDDGTAQTGPQERDTIKTVRGVFQAFATRDLEQALAFIHPQVRLWVVTAAVAREGRPYVGHDGIRQYFKDVDRVWEAIELLPLEFEVVGDAIVVLGEVRARGPAGELRQPAVWTWRFRDGLVIDGRVDSDLRAARDALGLASTVEDLVRRYVATFNRRDIDEMIALTDPGVVTYPLVIPGVRRKYAGHQGLRHWIRDVVAGDIGYCVVVREVRQLEEQRWALLGELVIDEAPVSPFASLLSVVDGLVDEAREYLSEEDLLRQLRHLP